MTVHQIFWGAWGVVVLGVLSLLTVFLQGRARDKAAGLEAEREYDHGKPHAPAQAGPASEDDLYPAQPALPSADRAGRQEDAPPAGPDALTAADTGPRTLEALAAEAGGQTVTEEIEQLEARLRVLYDRLGEEIAADIAAVSADLESGRLAVADWLPPRQCPMPAALALAASFPDAGVRFMMAGPWGPVRWDPVRR